MKHEKIIIFALIVATVFALYSRSLGNGFVHDDEGQIVENPYIKSLDYLPKAFTSCIWEAYADGCKERTNYYRPLHSVSYLFTYFVNSSAWLFHSVNIFYYILLCFAVFLFARRLLANRIAAYVATGIFLVHPMHSESVLWIASVPELLYGLFAILALLLYVSDSRYKGWGAPILFFAALLAKEPAIFIPVVILIYDLLFKGIKGVQVFSYWRYVLLFGFYFLMRTFAIGGMGKREDFYDFSFAERIYSGIFVFGEYIKKTFFSRELNPFIPFEPVSSLAYPSFLINAVLAVLFFLAAAWAIYKREKIVVLGLAIYALFISPVIIFANSVAENVITERYLLLPSFGAAIILGYLASKFLASKNALVKYSAIALAVIFSGYSASKVYAQNYVWRSSQALYEHSRNINEQRGNIVDVTSLYDLAVLYEKDGRIKEAKELYEKVIAASEKKKLIPSLAKAYNNLGAIYLGEKNYNKAIELFNESLSLNPKHERALSNMGIAYINQGKRAAAIESFIRALAINFRSESAGNNIRVLYSEVIELPSYDKKGNPSERYIFFNELLESAVWRGWRYGDTDYEAGEILKYNGGIKGEVVIKPEGDIYFPVMLFFSKNGKLYFNPHIQGSFDADGKKVSFVASILPDKIYIVLDNFKYYEIIPTVD